MSEIEAQPIHNDVEAAAVAEILAAVELVETAAPFAHPVAAKLAKRIKAAKPVMPMPVVSTLAASAAPDTPPAAVPADPVQEKADTMDMNTTADMGAEMQDKTTAMFGGMNDRAKGAMEKGAKLVEDATAFGKDNVEAIVESSRIAAKGFESLGQDMADYSRRSFESATATLRTLSSVKSPTEFLQLQGDLMRQSFDALVAQTSRSTETMLKLAGEVAQPISNRMAVAADKMKVAA